MKQRRMGIITLVAVCALCVCCFICSGLSAIAEADEPEVNDSAVELSSSEIYLPQPKVYGKWNYKINVYAGEDTSAEALAEGVIKYRFTETGTYTLKYTFISGNDEKVKTATLTVRDTTAPRLATVIKPAASYKKGETIEMTVKATDNGPVSAVEISIVRGGKDVTNKVYPGGPLTADKNGNYSVSFDAPDKGDYVVVFTATDGAGNKTPLEFKFSVEGGGLSVGAIVGISVASAVLVAGGIVLTVLLLKKKKEKKNGAK